MGSLPYAISLLNSLLTLLPQGSALIAKFQEDKARLQQMAAENRAPTDAEWAELDSSVKSLEGQIDVAANRA